MEGKRKAPSRIIGEDSQELTSRGLSKEIGSSQRRACVLATIIIDVKRGSVNAWLRAGCHITERPIKKPLEAEVLGA